MEGFVRRDLLGESRFGENIVEGWSMSKCRSIYDRTGIHVES